MNSRASTALVAYVASPHAGYLAFFRKYEGAELFILGDEFIQRFPELMRHLPGNRPEDAQMMIKNLGIFKDVHVLTVAALDTLNRYDMLVMPDERVARCISEEFLNGRAVTFDATWRLRWDWQASTRQNRPVDTEVVSTSELHRRLMGHASAQAEQSPDWWRQIGALLVRDGAVLLAAFNQHLPCEQSAYVEGDPRSSFEPGQCIDTSLALHAEIGVITEAARRGIATERCELYVTTFPCPPCAYACANSGISRLFYRDGYSLVAGADALRSRGVEIIRVQ